MPQGGWNATAYNCDAKQWVRVLEVVSSFGRPMAYVEETRAHTLARKYWVYLAVLRSSEDECNA